jgi:predicted RNA-binding Zn ribbon-like protein
MLRWRTSAARAEGRRGHRRLSKNVSSLVVPYPMMTSSGKSATRAVDPKTTPLWGGLVCLDLVNTVDWDEDDMPMEPEYDALQEPRDLTSWGKRLDLLPRNAPHRVTRDELAAVKRMRLALYRTIAAQAREASPSPDDLAELHRHYRQAVAQGELQFTTGAWRLDWPSSDPRRIRLAVIDDAMRTLADSDILARIRRCPGRGCGWLFLDRSGRRRWCSMETCGSRAKMRRLYARRKQSSEAD